MQTTRVPVSMPLMAKRKNQRQRRKRFRGAEAPQFAQGSPPPPKGKPSKALQLVECQITWEPLPDPEWQALPEPVRDRLLLIQKKIAQRNSTDHLAELEAAYATYPDVPTIGNWLAMAYVGAGRDAAALRVNRETHARHPDYLFTRIDLAHNALLRGCLNEAKDLLGHSLFLPTLYPERKVFHISEILAYTYAAANYHLLTADFRAAESNLDLMQRLEPNHPLTKQLQSLLRPRSRERFRFLASLQALLREPRKAARREPRKKPAQTRRDHTSAGSAQLELELPF